jgi:kynureninase
MMNTLEFARQCDQQDELAAFYHRFHHPKELIYLDGNSLGKQPIAAKAIIDEVITEQWGERLIRSWNEYWLELPQQIGDQIAQLLKVDASEISVGESTSVNLYKLAHALVKSGKFGKWLITDSLNFPTDNYILEGIKSQLNVKAIIKIQHPSDLEADLELLKENIARNPGVICLSLVSYKSAYRYPMKMLNDFAKEQQSIIIWDLSHAVGAIDLNLKDSNTLAAVGCTYKYLNGGPGAPAFLYIDQSLVSALETPIQGWFGHSRPFDFSVDYVAAKGIARFKAGTPQILSLASLKAGLSITIEATIERLHAKSHQLSNYLLDLIETELIPLGFTLESPRDAYQRGSHLTLSHQESWRICQCLQHPKPNRPTIIVDFRPDRFLRIGITPLYTRYEDLWLTVERLKEIVNTEEYLNHDGTKPVVT